VIAKAVPLTYVMRFAVGALFIFSGFIKANDPLGFSYKLEEYFEVFKADTGFAFFEQFAHIALPLAILICASEIVLGVMLIIGFRTQLTLWSFLEWSLLHENNSVLYTWGSKDSKLIRENCRSHRIECDWIESLVDLKPQYAKIRNFAKPVGLDKALKIEEIEFEGGRHRALPDAANLAKLFIKLFEYWEK